MEVSRSGYYKWLGRDASQRAIDREKLQELVVKAHAEHPSHGYRWIAAFIRIGGFPAGDSSVYKAFRMLGIRSETKHQPHYKPRKTKDKYPNLIFTTWETVDRPRQVIVSDMTAFHVWFYYFELTLYFDVFTKQIVSYSFGERRGDRMQYITGLQKVLDILAEEGCTEPVVLHTDQGSVYASVAYNDLIREKNISRSMSRAGKPTDNPVNESLNGWIKEELFMDFHLGECRSRDEVVKVVTDYVEFYNARRPSYALHYDTPDNYYRRYKKGELGKRDTFAKRTLSETPKFVGKRKKNKG